MHTDACGSTLTTGLAGSSREGSLACCLLASQHAHPTTEGLCHMHGRQTSGRTEPLTAAMSPRSRRTTGPGSQNVPPVQVLAATLSHASWMFTAASVLTIGAAGRVEAGTLVLLFAGSHSRLGRLSQLAARLAAQQPRPAPPRNRHCPCCSLCLRLGGRPLLIRPCLPPVDGLACVAMGHALVLDSRLIVLHR